MDLVYPIGGGSKWQNNELRYSLRSVEKHLQNFDKVFIVGQRPDFLNDQIIHVPQPLVTGNPAQNIANNLLAACYDERLSVDFLFLNDDYFFTQSVDATTYPTYYKCDLTQTIRNNVTDYRRHVKATLDLLNSRNLPTLNYDVHYPTTFNKFKLGELIEGNDFNRSFGFILKSLYFNTYATEAQHRLDCKQSQIKRPDGWREYVKTTEVFSIADTCINATFKQFMLEMYPEKSRWEL